MLDTKMHFDSDKEGIYLAIKHTAIRKYLFGAIFEY